MVQILTKPQFTASIKTATNSTKALQERVHLLCMYAADQLIQHRNVTPFEQIFNLPGGLNHKGIAQWVAEFLPADIVGGKVKVCGKDSTKFLMAQATIDAVLERCDATPFYTMHTGESISSDKATNYQSMILSLMAKARAEIKLGNPAKSSGLDLIENMFKTLPAEVQQDADKRAESVIKAKATKSAKKETIKA